MPLKLMFIIDLVRGLCVLICRNWTLSTAIEPYWYEYVDDNLKPELFKTDIADLVSVDNKIPQISSAP